MSDSIFFLLNELWSSMASCCTIPTCHCTEWLIAAFYLGIVTIYCRLLAFWNMVVDLRERACVYVCAFGCSGMRFINRIKFYGFDKLDVVELVMWFLVAEMKLLF